MKLKKPNKHKNVPKKAQWLSGIGAGSWFFIIIEAEKYRIKRFSPEGILECNNIFNVIPSHGFEIEKQFRFVYLSHCKICRIEQNNKTFVFNAE